MHDNVILPTEPAGVFRGRPNVDLGNVGLSYCHLMKSGMAVFMLLLAWARLPSKIQGIISGNH